MKLHIDKLLINTKITFFSGKEILFLEVDILITSRLGGYYDEVIFTNFPIVAGSHGLTTERDITTTPCKTPRVEALLTLHGNRVTRKSL